MSLKDFPFTSESVSEGHPDKVADQVSDAILDAALKEDPNSRVACETLIKTGLVVLAGEVTTNANIRYNQIAREVISEIGYNSTEEGFDSKSAAVLCNITQQSPDIAQGVNSGEGTFKEMGAGDQGLMFGFACDDTPELMPLPISLSHKLVSRLSQLRHKKAVDFLRPDSKSQVTVNYVDGKPQSIGAIVISTQHSEDVSLEEVQEFIKKEVVSDIVPAELINNETIFYINPTGRFVEGGPHADAGLTGRKIIVDTYGGYGRHGGGAFSGKDPSKVDRSAAYAARYLAKNVVNAGLASKCEIQLSYAIGVAEPTSVLIDTFGTNEKYSDEQIAKAVKESFDLRPQGIIEALDLKKPIYRKSAAYGHFGRTPLEDGSFSWEKTDLAELILSKL